jgi:phytoene synthase
MNEDYEHCEALVRERDRARFLATLFAPAGKRPYLFALYAFDQEIAHVPDAVREPMAGEIRFQWWREALGGERAEEAKASPVAAAVLETIAQCRLPVDALFETIEARRFDLLGQPMESRVALEEYLDATSCNVVELAARILDDTRDANAATRHAGRAIGLTRLLRDFPRDVSKGRLFVPLDLLAAHEVHTASVWAGESSGGLRAALTELQQNAKRELGDLRAIEMKPSILAAFLPATLAPLFLARMEKTGYDPFRTDLDVSRLRSQFALWRAARSGKI